MTPSQDAHLADIDPTFGLLLAGARMGRNSLGGNMDRSCASDTMPYLTVQILEKGAANHSNGPRLD